MVKVLSVLVACILLYKLIPLVMGMDGIVLLFALFFGGLVCIAIDLFFSMLSAMTTFRK
jgi:hypothetical protein